MLLRTHLAFAILSIILLFNYVDSKIIFLAMVLVATVVPDLDSKFSSWGRHLIFRPLQIFLTHRGIFHSFTFAILVSILLFFFWPVGVFGFFVGYSVHLICDIFTKEGVKILWPLKFKLKGIMRSGGRIEDILFLIIVFLNVLLILRLLFF